MKLTYTTFYIFFIVLEFIILAYLIVSFFPDNNWIRHKVIELAGPLLKPIRFLLKHSMFKSNIGDFSPVISFIIINYLQRFFSLLM